MVGNVDALSSDNVLSLAASALRRDDNTDVSLKTPYEAVALIGHACMVAVGFRLVGLGEEHTIGLFHQFSSSAVTDGSATISKLRKPLSALRMEFERHLLLPLCALTIFHAIPAESQPPRQQCCYLCTGSGR